MEVPDPGRPAALIFDFDGTLCDTESASFEAWREVLLRFGVEIELAEWVAVVGGGEAELATWWAAVGAGLPLADVLPLVRARHAELCRSAPLSPGAHESLRLAAERGVRLAVASSSPRPWVEQHLARLGVRDLFAAVVCAADVDGACKPSPAVYLRALELLGVAAADALAIEDSAHGAAAAIASGIPVVVVPNDATRHLRFPDGCSLLPSLADLPRVACLAGG